MTGLVKRVDKKARHLLRRPRIWFSSLVEQETPYRHNFHHIPKCAGTSAVDALTQWFAIIKDYPRGWSDQDAPSVYNRFCENPVNMNKLRRYQALVGHYHVDRSYLHQRYPESLEDNRYRIFTFLRDPLELQKSLYYYEIRNRRISDDEPIEKVLLLRKNYLAARFPCDESNYQQVLNRYFFIGLVEKYQESLDALADSIGKPRIDLKVYNKTSKPKATLSASFVSEFKEINQLDFELYDYAKSLYGNQIK